MTCFVDASSLVAIVAREPDWELYASRVDAETKLLWSPLSRWETIIAFSRLRQASPAEAREIVASFAEENGFILVPVGAHEADIAIEAYIRYGKRSGHPARLNMGDCFAYACAKTHGARLLYKGDDFSHTDLA